MYYVLKNKYDDKHVLVTRQPDVKTWAKINRGAPLLDGWPDGVTLQYSDDNPEGVLLTDHITNTRNWLIISEKFKHALDELDLDYLEYLPVGFLDHKGRTKNEPYWIVNFTKLFSAVDREQSIYKDRIGGKLGSFKKLVLADEIVKSGPPIFCLEEQPRMFLFRQDFKEKVDAQGLTGFELVATDEYKSLD